MSTPTLSIILPTYNECSWLPETLAIVCSELNQSGWTNAELIVVNDGSSDNTIAVLDSLNLSIPLKVLSHANSGRFYSRLVGLNASKSAFVLLIDSRVHVNEGSFKFLREQLELYPERRIWAGDVDIANSYKAPAALWLAVTRLAWRRYFKSRMLTSFDEKDFDYFPKGTTFFLAPRELLLAACSTINSHFEDNNLLNDDTLLIRPLSKDNRIYISPDFRCTYFSRDTLKKFMRHSFHRGTVFVDAYFRRDSRYLPYFYACLVFPVAFTAALICYPFPAVYVSLVTILLPIVLLRRIKLSWREIAGFYRALPIFIPTYGLGILRGLFLYIRAVRTRA
jgi:glycosyltransferase involved in cell wall biosynthesis